MAAVGQTAETIERTVELTGASPPASASQEPPRPIDPYEEGELRWYFEHGVARLEQSSNTLDQLERLAFYFHAARPCRACGGKWARVAADGTVLQVEVPGTGFITSTEEWRQRRALARLLGHELKLPGDATCQKCGGTGWRPGGKRRARGPITARPTGSSVKGNGAPSTGGNDSLRKLGRLDGQLARLRRADPEAYATLEAYYCPAGVEMKLTSLWHLVPAGKTMLRGNDAGLTPRQFFENLSERQQKRPDPNRHLQFQAADRQAREKLEQAQHAWTALLDQEAA